jgi:tRNA(Met) C34 N-acetyltransferase TmcA
MTNELYGRSGRFTLSKELLMDSPNEILTQLFAGIIVFSVVHDVLEGTFRYTAVSMAFEPVTPGTLIPEYIAEIEELPEGTYVVGWRKK